jgi:putative membrane protein
MNPGTALPAKPHPRNAAHWFRVGLQAEFALFRRPMLVLSVLAITLVPSLYAVFYISSLWDPYGHLDRLPAALVNTDRGVSRGGRNVNLGNSVVKRFEQQPPFHFVQFPSAEAANQAILRGETYLALIIPPDFSERALAARDDQPAVFSLRFDEGANYTSAIITKRFGAELAHILNEQLNRERWAAIVGDPDDPTNESVRSAIGRLRDGSQRVHEGAQRVQEGSSRLDDGIDKAAAGADRLADGTERFSQAAVQLSDGMGRVAAGVQEMRDRLPSTNQLHELADGSKAAVAGEGKVVAGIDKLIDGGDRLHQGAGQLRQGAAKVPIFGGRLADGAGQLETGISNLDTGLGQAANGSRELDSGLTRLDAGIQPLAGGLAELETNLELMSDQLPTAEQRDEVTAAVGRLRDGGLELSNGLARLRDGSQRLAVGSKELETGSAELAAGLDRLQTGFAENLGDAKAGGLAASIRVDIQSTSGVPNNGTAFSPYFTSLSLWLGGIMMTFVFHFRRLVEPMNGASRPVRWLAKAAVPMIIGVLQATVIIGVLRFGFGIVFARPLLVWLAAVLGSLTFVAIIFSFVVIFGDAGRLVAVMLLILQLAAAGGIYPVELSGRFYEAVNPFLPLTALVRAFRATMFGAFNGDWLGAALLLGVTACVAAVLGIALARWKYVTCEAYCPAVEFS